MLLCKNIAANIKKKRERNEDKKNLSYCYKPNNNNFVLKLN